MNLVLWLVKQRVTWPFSGDFWRKTTTNHHEPLQNHHKPPQTIMKSHSKWDLILNLGLWLVKSWVTWYYLENFREKLPRTTMKHYEPPRTTTNHHKPLQITTNHHEPSRSLIQNEIWYWILDSDWLNSGSHDIFLRILEKNYHWTITNHHETSWIIMNHHKTSRTITNHHEPPQNITNHHEPPQKIMKHLKLPGNIMNHHEPPWNITNHHKSSPIIMKHRKLS